MPNLVLIIGPQAVGKMTVGQELEKITGYKLFYNHMTIELLTKIFDYDQKIFRNRTDKTGHRRRRELRWSSSTVL